MSFNLGSCKYDFASDTINIFVNVYDASTSMDEDINAMREANRAFYEDFSKFEERGSIAIAKAEFSGGFDMTSFRPVKEFDTSYNTYGSTALYNAIVRSTKNTIAYYNEIVKRLNVRPRITYLVFSDGDDNCGDDVTYNAAKQALKELNSMDATTVFVAFRDAISSGVGENLGFTCTRDITSAQELVACMGGELSKSCKEQSRSAYSLKSEFFSKAEKNTAEDEVEAQPLLDDDFFTV